MRRTSDKEVQAVSRLGGPARFDHFVKRVADSEIVWALWDQGWALMATDDGTKVLPLWPAREYAELHCVADWVNYEAREISLDELLDELLPRIARDKVLLGVFPIPEGRGVTVTVEQLSALIRKELQNYE
jgi:hypothetical protein